MGDLGAIGKNGSLTKRTVVGNPALPPSGLIWRGGTSFAITVSPSASRLQSITAGADRLVWGGEDLIEGYTSSPCLRMDAKGKWRFRWALTIAQHSISVFVKQADNLSPRPSLVVKNNPAIGIPADIEVFAPPSTDWIQISSGTFPVTAVGATWVELKCNVETNVGFSPCYFDLISKT